MVRKAEKKVAGGGGETGTTKEQIVAALALMDDEGMTAYGAAKALGIPAPSVHAAFNRRKLKILEARAAGVCEKCGAPVDSKGRYTTQGSAQKKA
jgi:hypothetical protein